MFHVIKWSSMLIMLATQNLYQSVDTSQETVTLTHTLKKYTNTQKSSTPFTLPAWECEWIWKINCFSGWVVLFDWLLEDSPSFHKSFDLNYFNPRLLTRLLTIRDYLQSATTYLQDEVWASIKSLIVQRTFEDGQRRLRNSVCSHSLNVHFRSARTRFVVLPSLLLHAGWTLYSCSGLLLTFRHALVCIS